MNISNEKGVVINGITWATSANFKGAMEQKPFQKRGTSENPIVKSRNKFNCLSGLLVLVLTLGLFSSCGDSAHPSKLVGKWKVDYQMSNMDRSEIHKNMPENMELLQDGTGVCDSWSITWEISDKRFIIKSALIGWAGNYKVSGSELCLINDNGKYAILKKQ